MPKLVHNVTKIISVISLNLVFVVANYCEFGTCEENEYCCGDNKCCKTPSSVWYLWVLGIVTLLLLFILYIWIRFRKNYGSINQYHQLSTNEPEMEAPIM